MTKEKYIDTISGEELIKRIYAGGTTEYMKKDNSYKYHRLDGPAIIFGDGISIQYWLNGKQYTELEFNIQLRKEKIKLL